MSEAPQIPDHTLLRLIGRGSYGEVWLARNVMGVGRAVKIVRRASFDSDRPYEREFAAVRRYEPVSRMADGLVNVLHVGRCNPDGLFYYVMELADSEGGTTGEDDYRPRTLRSVLEAQRRQPLSDCMAVAQGLVQAVASLHRTGLTHRDIKPSNIIFVNGRAKLADIGLVSDLGESRSFVGTEGYIPPEGPGLPGADLYALGMVLYEMATGFPPAEYPRVPQEWIESGDGPAMEFVEIVLQATEPDSARRYQSAGELQADLALLESGKSVRRVRLLERRWKTARRIAALAAAFAVLLGGGMWMWHQAALREERAVSAETLARRAKADERTQRFLALRERAARLVRSELAGWRPAAIADIDEAAKLNPGDVELHNTLVTALSRADISERARWSQPGSTTAGPILSPDTTLVAVAEEDGSFRILRTADGSEVQHLRHWLIKLQPSFESAFTADGQYFGVRFSGYRTLAPVLEKSFLYESWAWFRVSDGKIVLELPSGFVCDSAPGRHLEAVLSCDRGSRALVTHDLRTGKEVSRVPLPVPVAHFHSSPDGKLAAVQTDESQYCEELVVVRTATGEIVARWKNLRYMSGAVAWLPDSRRLALGGSDAPRGVRIVSMDRPADPASNIAIHSAEIVDVAISPDGRYALTGSWDQTTLLTDINLKQVISILPGWSHAGSLGFDARGQTCWRRKTKGQQSTELVWCQFHQPLAAIHSLSGQAMGAAFSSDGRWLAAAHSRGLTITDFTTGKSVSVPGITNASGCAFARPGDSPQCAVATPAGLRLAELSPERGEWSVTPPMTSPANNVNMLSAVGTTGRVMVWCGGGPSYILENGAVRQFLPSQSVVSGSVTADGSLAAYSRGNGDHLYLCNASGERLAKLPAGTEPWVSVSPDGSRLTANSLDEVLCWDTASRNLLWRRPKEFPSIRGCPLPTPDKRHLIVRTGLQHAILDANSGETRAILAPAFPAEIGGAALDFTGARLAVCGRSFVVVWDLQGLTREMESRGMW